MREMRRVEGIPTMTRAHHFTRKQKAELHLKCMGKCNGCGAKLKTGEGEADHILPVILGGESVLENGQILCRLCHVGKTGHDVRRTRKADRQRDYQSGASDKPSRLQSAGFPPRQKQKNAASAPIQKWAAWRENSD